MSAPTPHSPLPISNTSSKGPAAQPDSSSKGGQPNPNFAPNQPHFTQPPNPLYWFPPPGIHYPPFPMPPYHQLPTAYPQPPNHYQHFHTFNRYQQSPVNTFLPHHPPANTSYPPYHHPDAFHLNQSNSINSPPKDTLTTSSTVTISGTATAAQSQILVSTSTNPTNSQETTAQLINSSFPGPTQTETTDTVMMTDDPVNNTAKGQDLVAAVDLIQNKCDTDWPPIGKF
ncbi:uncharacterized protein MELLADRAFT_84554 [Melampsora larici-populina 98AG31]|uniref:Uncharacterized protein n=1 Tax=Melampsora larici-populina (strain 98AG31 / pathotype 3-4-7) TaxID=747676 RepID=F4SCF8_MELLP|nr:uncharacterized protein MELLADRAFT_84554 [Melampsora larici-populina 98AG31]EGF97671.1 hypothetical protein MELLADRAFT_84554 [Melampsora larici-populina 98AG31]